MPAGKDAHSIREAFVLPLAPDRYHLGPIEVLVTDRKEVKQFVSGCAAIAGIPGAVCDDTRNLALRTIKRHRTRNPGTT